GFETEDLNKAPVLPRPRVTIGLPGRLSLIVAGTPPIRLWGVKAALLALGLERPLVEMPRWSLGVRGYGQFGTANASYTCPASRLAFAPGAPGNTDGCQALSSDTATLRYVGGEASVAYQPSGPGRLSPPATLGFAYMDGGFQVDALVFGYVDHTEMVTRGMIASGSAGVTARLTSRLSMGLDVFYSPIRVSRSPGASAQNDGFLNVRTLISYRLR
ncbi:MAG: hypothetical protein LUO93_01875, partial [Methanomicrobiales archaeon]|nr:hypothetical protein [Methanomicrobiales archaeon]